MKKVTLMLVSCLLFGFKICRNEKERSMSGSGYGTHMEVLLAAVMNTTGPILEMGCGDFSTPLIHAICSQKKRYILSTETDKSWLSLFLDLKRDWHHFLYVPVYDDDLTLNPKPHLWNEVGNDRHWGVVFIDHRPGERRVIDIQRLRKNTDIFVIHDTETASYHYEPLLSTFKYKYLHNRYTTYTAVVSDVIDLHKFLQ